jgi:hypothetical protein
MVAFPLLMANAVDWLYPLAGTQAIRPGSAIALAPGSTVNTPLGRAEQVPPSGLFNATDEAGIYSVTPSGASAPQIRFAVNMADESGYTGNTGGAGPEHPELNRTLDRVGEGELTNNEFWLPLAAVALALLWGEWIVYCWKRGSM